MKKAEAVLGWAVEKMEERYDLLARTGVRHLDSYNKLKPETRLERMGIDSESEEANEDRTRYLDEIIRLTEEHNNEITNAVKDQLSRNKAAAEDAAEKAKNVSEEKAKLAVKKSIEATSAAKKASKKKTDQTKKTTKTVSTKKKSRVKVV